MAERRLAGRWRRKRRVHLEDRVLAIDYDGFRVGAQDLALTVVRVVKLAEACFFDTTLGQI